MNDGEAIDIIRGALLDSLRKANANADAAREYRGRLIAEAHEKGVSLREIGEAVEVSHETIRRLLRP